MGLANRENTFKGELNKTFDKLQTAATIVAPIFVVFLIRDTIEGVYEFLEMVSGSCLGLLLLKMLSWR